MSSIDKLSILGIRSFDCHERETIQFNTPLTLIIGQNGSGKTTIIECLKYATTGFFPPNCKNGAFIHDPSITGEKDVFAQVKLAFLDTNGDRLICARSLQLSVKGKSRSQKTLDGNLIMVKSGERSSISTRVSELDQLIPHYLGVSKSVLDNVIFCHQEESHWPLSESSVLKKKFDEIFEATRCTKALEQIKTIRKEQVQQNKIEESTLLHYRSDRERLYTIRAQVEMLKESQNELEQKMIICSKNLESVGKAKEKLEACEKEVTRKQQELELLNHELALMIEIKITFDNSGLDLLSNDLEQLLEQQVQYEDILEDIKKELEGKKCLLKEIETELPRMYSTLLELQTKKGSTSQILDSYITQLEKQYEIARDVLINKFNIEKDSIDTMPKEDVVKEYHINLKARLEKLRRELNKLKITHGSVNSNHTKSLQDLIAKYSAADQKKTMLHRQLRQVKEDYMKQKLILDEKKLLFAESELKCLELTAIQSQLQEKKAKFQSEDFDNKIASLQTELSVIENDLDEQLKLILKDNSAAMSSFLQNSEQDLKYVTNELQFEQLKCEILKILTDIDQVITARVDLQNIEKTISVLQRNTEKDGNDIEQEILEMQEQLYKSHIASTIKSAERDALIEVINNINIRLKATTNVESIEYSIDTRVREILDKQLNASESEYTQSNKIIETILSLVSDLKAVKMKGLKLLEAKVKFQKMSMIENELKNTKKKSTIATSAMIAKMGVKTKVEELQIFQKLKRSLLKNLMQEKNEEIEKINLIEAEIQSMVLELSNQSSTILEKQIAEKSYTDLSQKKLQLESELSQVDKEVTQSNQEIATKRNEMEERKELDACELAEAQNNLSMLELLEAQLQQNYIPDMNLDIERKEYQIICSKFEALQTSIKEKEAFIIDLKQSFEILIEKEQKAEQDKSMVTENVKYKKALIGIHEIESKISSTKVVIEKVNLHEFSQHKKNLVTKFETLIAEKGGIHGEIRQLNQTISRHIADITTNFSDIEEKYRKQLIKVKLIERTNEDLATYSQALDSAIIKYHSLKMDEVNRIIDELWKATYCGTDVDTILIRSDKDGARHNSYNYRVCMVKSNVELDMRGRCSAGQKVLASIIIRIALAECFSCNCGLLCLDEPTTNLDIENIESLAKSLGKIVESRRLQANFQLVIITHDESFIRMMNCTEYCESYYRISRNLNQKSIIERHKIEDVF